MRDLYVRPTVMDDAGKDWSGRYDEVMTSFHYDDNREKGQTSGLIGCAIDVRDEVSVVHDSLEEDLTRDKCTRDSKNSTER
jgi:hypothetical protein